MSLDYKLPDVGTIEAELARVISERDNKVWELKALYAVELRRLRALLKLAQGVESRGPDDDVFLP